MSINLSGNDGGATLALASERVVHGAQKSTTPAISTNIENPRSRENLSPAEVRQAAAHLQDLLEPMTRELQFSIDEETNKIVIKVIDTTNDSVLMQFPSEEIIALTHAIAQQAQGFFISLKT